MNQQSCIENLDMFDKVHYDETLSMSAKLKSMEQEGSKILPSFPSLQRDVWGSLYKYAPKLSSSVDKELTVNKKVMDKLFANTDFLSSREFTKMDDLASALSTLNMSNNLMDIIRYIDTETKDMSKKMNDTQEQADKKRAVQEALKQMLDDLLKQMEQLKQNSTQQGPETNQQDGQQGNGEQQQKIEQLQKKIDNAKRKSNAAGRSADKLEKQAGQEQQQLQNMLEQMMNSSDFSLKFSSAIQSSFNDAKDITNEVNQIIGASDGCGVTHQPKPPVTLNKKLEIANLLQNNPQIRKTLKLAGKMQNIAMKKHKEVTVSTTLKQDIEMGNSLERILPSEFMQYRNQATRKEFLRKFAEGQCLQFSTKGKEKLGKGPVVICRDVSPSMKSKINDEGDTRAEWSSAVGYALYKLAKKEKREFYLINFNDSIEYSEKITSENLINLIDVSTSGGTNFEHPLDEAIRVMKSVKEFRKADIIFMTDGISNVSDKFLESFLKTKKDMNISVYSILLATVKKDIVEKFSDHVIQNDGSLSFSKVFEV